MKFASRRRPAALDFSGMELHPVERRMGYSADEALAPPGRAEHVGGVGRTDAERVHEVKRRFRLQTFGELRGVLPANRLPADVGEL